MVVQTTVPGVFAKLTDLLRARPALAGVAVHEVDFGAWAEAEAIVLTRATVTGSGWRGMAAGRLQIVEQAELAGYVFVGVPAHSDEAARAAWARAHLLWGEVMQQLRDDANLNGALAIAQRKIPLRSDTHTWRTWPAEDGGAVTRVRIDWTAVWEASA